jgi:CheY-like chemotaxis protein
VPDPATTVLVVDDNVDHTEFLRVAGGRVAPHLCLRAVYDGQQALDYLDGVPPFDDRTQHPYPSLVLLDLMMPILDGFGVLARLRNVTWEKPVPVVVLTTSSNPVDETRAMALGADAFHSKPAGVDDLGTLFQDIVGRWLS